MKILGFVSGIFMFLLSLESCYCQIKWQSGDWAFACDFVGNDIGKVASKGDQCSNKCLASSTCTHYVWKNLKGGICYLKSGIVYKNDAIFTGNQAMVCGIINSRIPCDTNINSSKGTLLFSNDFNSINELTDNWIQETGGNGWGNNELEYYTDNNRNTEVSNGILTIHTRNEFYVNRNYTSARLISKGSFKYGIFEMRAKIPYGRGTWPAFWLLAAKRPLNWPNDGEIDIMEHVGYDMNIIHAAIHCKNYNGGSGTTIEESIQANDVSNVYHLYQLYWTTNIIQMFVDNVCYFTYKKKATSTYDDWPYDNEMNIILNTAVGGNWGGLQGVNNSIFPFHGTKR